MTRRPSAGVGFTVAGVIGEGFGDGAAARGEGATEGTGDGTTGDGLGDGDGLGLGLAEGLGDAAVTVADGALEEQAVATSARTRAARTALRAGICREPYGLLSGGHSFRGSLIFLVSVWGTS